MALENIKDFQQLVDAKILFNNNYERINIENIKSDAKTNVFALYKPYDRGDKMGFEFVILDCVAWLPSYGNKKTSARERESEWEVLFHGQAMFDGVRHMYMGHEISDNENYIHYLHTDNVRGAMDLLDFLVKRYCSQPHDR